MIPVKEAKSIIHKHIPLSGNENVLLKDSGNRVLAQDIIATFPMPSFDNSAMDGFAVRAVDTKGADQSLPVTLKMVGVSSAGSPGDITLGPGECAQCMTGAIIPNGADAIVMVEDTSGFSDTDSVQIFQEAKTGKHIREKGEEIQVFVENKVRINQKPYQQLIESKVDLANVPWKHFAHNDWILPAPKE